MEIKRRDSDDFDPLGIAKCKTQEVPRFSPKAVSKSKRASDIKSNDDSDFLFQMSPLTTKKATKLSSRANQSGLSTISTSQHWQDIQNNNLNSPEEIFNQKEQKLSNATRRRQSSSVNQPELLIKPQKDNNNTNNTNNTSNPNNTTNTLAQDSLYKIDFESFIKWGVPASSPYQVIHQRLQQYIDSSKLA